MRCPDAVLVRRALAGDRRSFDQLVARYSDVVLRIAVKMTANSPEVPDLVQEAFLQAYVKLGQLQEPARFGGWLRALTCNTCKMWLRRQRRNVTSLDDLLADGDGGHQALPTDQTGDAHEQIEASERRQALRRAVRRLSPKNRRAVWLHYFEGHSCADVARQLGVPVSTVAGRLHKSRKILARDAWLREIVWGTGAVGTRAADRISAPAGPA